MCGEEDKGGECGGWKYVYDTTHGKADQKMSPVSQVIIHSKREGVAKTLILRFLLVDGCVQR